MEINRFCTTVEQSKKLAEFLPIASADLWYAERYAGQVLDNGEYIVEDAPNYYLSFTRPSENNYSQDTIKDIPCWSLDALLSIFTDETTIRVSSLKNGDRIYSCDSFEYGTPAYDNAIDAAVDMVIKMHKENLI